MNKACFLIVLGTAFPSVPLGPQSCDSYITGVLLSLRAPVWVWAKQTTPVSHFLSLVLSQSHSWMVCRNWHRSLFITHIPDGRRWWGGRGTKEKVWTETAEKKNILKVPKKSYPTTILCEPVNAGVCTSYFRKQMHMKYLVCQHTSTLLNAT